METLRIGIIGTGKWTQVAHIPAFSRCDNAKVVAICGHDLDRTREVAKKYNIPFACTDRKELLKRSDVDAVDITTSTSQHFQAALDAIDAGKPILCEKPLAPTYKEGRILSEKAAAKNIATMMGFTFRYSPVILRMKEMIKEGFVGTPFHLNGFEQNSQFINPNTPFRWNPDPNSKKIMPGSLEEYGAHLIDLSLWMMGDLNSVVGYMGNFFPQRHIRDSDKMLPINIEDGCVWLGKFVNGAVATFQTSFIAIGGYPGIEIRVYGSKGALIARLVEEFGVTETLQAATPDKVEFVPQEPPKRLYPRSYKKGDTWIELQFGNLVQHFVDEILKGKKPEGGFLDGAKSEEVATAVYQSHLDRRWVDLPLG
jgi:predicted dehydrogenase